MCRRARARARTATIKTALCLSRCTVAACKFVVLTHAALTIATVGAMTISQHPTTSDWARLSHSHYNHLKYLNTHATFPWVVVGVVSAILSFLDGIATRGFSCSKTFVQALLKRKKTASRRAEPPPDAPDAPPDAPPRQQRRAERPKEGKRHRLYPTTYLPIH